MKYLATAILAASFGFALASLLVVSKEGDE